MLDIPRDTTQYQIAGPTTFRLSSRILFKKQECWGGNHQNKSDELRRIYVPDKEKIFVQTDQAGAEALVVAYYCRAGRFRSLFLNNIKSHVFVALYIFNKYWVDNGNPEAFSIKDLNIPEIKKHPSWKALADAIKNHKTYYFIGKKTCHSANYRMRGFTFAGDVLKESAGKVRLSVNDADKFLLMYHKLFPEINEWHFWTEEVLRKTGMVRNLQGFPIHIGGILSDETFRTAIASGPQSTVGVITHRAIAKMQSHIEKYKLDWDLLNNCHDSLLVQCPDKEQETQDCCYHSREFMQQDLVSPRGEPFQMKAEVSTGYNWGKHDPLHPEENPDGMKEYTFKNN